MDKLEKALQKARHQRSAPPSGFVPIDPKHLAPPVKPTDDSTPGFVPPSTKTANETLLERHRIVAHRTRSAEADAFRFLRTQVLQMMAQSGYKTLAITSPNYGDGKTTIALNLAISIVLDLKQTVLLVDLDLRKPKLHEFAGVNPAAGLTDHLIKGTPLSECIIRLDFDRLSLLPAGEALDHSSEFLGAPRMATLAQELKTRYPDRLVIYDMPPVLTQDDPIAFMPHVDAALLVVREDVTKTTEISRCLETLSNANILGTVLNDSF